LSGDDLRLETLETKLAFHEEAVQQLSDVLVAQQARIDRLEARVQLLGEQLRDRAEERAGPDEPPPHY
jgi:SlyX protein